MNTDLPDIQRLIIDKIDYSQYRRSFFSLPPDKRTALKESYLRHLETHGVLNLYQELKMQSQFVESHKDISMYDDTAQLHSHSFYELLYICSGRLEYLLGDKRCKIQKGDIILIPPGLSHRPLFTRDMGDECYERIVVWLSTAFADSCRCLWPDLSDSPALLLGNGQWSHLHDHFSCIYEESRLKRRAYESVLYGSALTLIALLSRALSCEEPLKPEQNGLLDDVLHFIEVHLSEKITLESTAQQFFVSQSTLSKLFRSRMDESFYQFVTQRRLIAAKHLIEKGLPLNQICEQTGFCDYAAFYRAFKRECKLSPIQYRELICPKSPGAGRSGSGPSHGQCP